MHSYLLGVTVVMFLVPPAREPVNPWKERVAAAVEQARSQGTPDSYREALEVTWRADDWQTGLELAQMALERFPGDRRLTGLVTRTLWRAGQIRQAEELAATLTPDCDDRHALAALVSIHLAGCRVEEAARAARSLEALRPRTGDALYHVLAVRLYRGRLSGTAGLLAEAERITRPENGYPETLLADALPGLAQFVRHVGEEPINQVARHGSAAMQPLPLLGLPSCWATINGCGPYRMVLDTGGSITLSLDTRVAEQIGLRSVAPTLIRGVAGQEQSGQALVERLQIGSIECRRVLTHIFPVGERIADSAMGIVGTGLFGQARLTLDFAGGRLQVEASRPAPAPGVELEARVLEDAKLLALVTIDGLPATGLLDSGADAVALSPALLRRLHPDRPVQMLPPVAIGVGQGTAPQVTLTHGVDLVLAGRMYRDFSGLGLDVLDTLLGPALGVQCDVLLGMPVFRDMKTFTVDFPQCRIWVEWLERRGGAGP